MAEIDDERQGGALRWVNLAVFAGALTGFFGSALVWFGWVWTCRLVSRQDPLILFDVYCAFAAKSFWIIIISGLVLVFNGAPTAANDYILSVIRRRDRQVVQGRAR